MPNNTNYLEITIGNQRIQTSDPEALPFTIDYKLEDESDFQVKRGTEAIQITVPATLLNSKTANSFDQVGIEDMTDGEVFKGFQPLLVKHNGYELMKGTAVLSEATETDKPEDYTFDLYAGNNDWIIALKESTLFDFLKHISFTFNKQNIINSWQFDGRNEALPYVFAPVRYGRPMGDSTINGEVVTDYNMLPEYMKPAISKYWLLYWAFKSIGYRVQSDFFNTDLFRRQVMPWTWGNFLFSDGTRLSNLDFLAKSVADYNKEGDFDGYVDLNVTNTTTLGAFDNNKTYSYSSVAKEMRWTYKPQFNYGNLDATFHLNVFINAFARRNSDVNLKVRWFKNNIQFKETQLVNLNSPAVGNRSFIGNVDEWATANINPGDVITAKLYLYIFDSGTGEGRITAKVDTFELDYFRIPLGGTITFENYASFSKYKFLDCLRGIVDEFNLTIQTDTVNKVVFMEPAHRYKVPGDADFREGFFRDTIDWHMKQDLSKKSKRILFKDYEREVMFNYKNDTSDGLLKKVQDRNTNILAAAKYVLPDRFKAGKKAHENRFFSPVMHYTVDQWGSITGKAPQMVAMVPENISNTAKDEAQNTFQPKSCYYKGVIAGMGWIFDGTAQTSFPFMFAVNYMPGGENDPVLSYSDERIGTPQSHKIAQGLFKRFFWQRMANMRNGEWYNTWFRLTNYDVAGALHREFKTCRNQQWELIAIYNYAPLKVQSTNVLLRRFYPVSYEDFDNTFPTDWSIKNNSPRDAFDIKYAQLVCLSSDVPKEI